MAFRDRFPAVLLAALALAAWPGASLRAQEGNAATKVSQGQNATQDAAQDQAQEQPSNVAGGWLTGDWGGARQRLADRGVSFSAVYMNEVLGNPSGGNYGQGVVDEGLLNLGVDLDLEKLAGWHGLTFHVNGFWTHGSSLTRQDVGDFSVLSNIDAMDSVWLDEAWFQQSLLGDRVSVKAGQLAADTEFFVTQYGALFLNSTFGAFPLLANNALPYYIPAYPQASPGIRLKVTPVDPVYVQVGVYNGDAGSQQTNNHGVRYAFNGAEGVLILSEAGYLLNQGKDDKGLPGTYKLGSWVHTADFSTWASQAAAANGTGPLQGNGVNYAVYGVADQALWRRGDAVLGAFVRAGASPGVASQVDLDLDAGLNLAGAIPGRKADALGLAFSRASISRDYSDASVAQGGPAYRAETFIEATYSLQIVPGWTLQPDLQYLFAAGAQAGGPDALVLGLRSTFSF